MKINKYLQAAAVLVGAVVVINNPVPPEVGVAGVAVGTVILANAAVKAIQKDIEKFIQKDI